MEPTQFQHASADATCRQSDQTPIQEFYSNANVFVTGSTGFLGKILVEKLLRSCPEVSTIYLLVRSKKGKDMHARVDEIFDDVIFDRLKSDCPKFRHKIVGVGGDCSLPNLGLSEQDTKILIKEVSFLRNIFFYFKRIWFLCFKRIRPTINKLSSLKNMKDAAKAQVTLSKSLTLKNI